MIADGRDNVEQLRPVIRDDLKVSEKQDDIDISMMTASESLSSSPSGSEASTTNSERLYHINKLCSEFTANADAESLERYADEVVKEFEEALNQNSQISMLPNYGIQPTGKEEGAYLAVDLGGSTLRVSVVQIDPCVGDDQIRASRVHIVAGKSWVVNDSSKIIDRQFFRWLCSKVHEVLEIQTVIDYKNAEIDTGITWSFPLDHISHNSGRIVHVAKGYTIMPDIFGQDLKACVEDTMKKHFNLQINVRSIINDSVAVYSAGAFLNNNIKLGMVLGTGTNMSLSLDPSKLIKEKCLDGEVILFNSELSFFGHKCCSDLVTMRDLKVDQRYESKTLDFKPYLSPDPSTETIFQPLEQMTSGRYLSELVRLSVIEFIERGSVFASVPGSQMDLIFKPYEGFSGELLCIISEAEDMGSIKIAIANFFRLDPNIISDEDIETLKLISSSVILRAAYIISVSIVAFIKLLESHNSSLISNDRLTIGYVGSILANFHSYRNLVLNYVNSCSYVSNRGLEVDFMSIDDSSIVGSAVGAAYFKNT